MDYTTRISYNCEDISFELSNKNKTSNWIVQTSDNEGFIINYIDFIFCSDNYLLSINQQYLNHNTYTDIITFNYNENNEIAGDIFISIDRIKENAHKFAVSFNDELHRVIIHGVLHLIGYNDKSASEKKIMREKENQYLAIFLK